jgi:glycosyltransferase involved in cell wall biosynthesis
MLVTPCFGYGGLEQVVLSIVALIDRSRFHPSFCTLLAPEPALYREMERLDLPCYILDKGEGLNAGLPFRLAAVMRRERVRLVNAHDIGATLYAAASSRLGGVRTLIHTDHSQILTKKKHRAAYRFVMRNLVDFSIAVSSSLEDHLVNVLGVSRSAVTTIPNGIDTARFAAKADTSRIRRELGIGESERIIGSIGRLTEQKGMAHLIRAFATVAARDANTRLVIVGDGMLRLELEGLGRELGVREKVVFTGIRMDVPVLLGLFDVFAVASLWEGQPIAIMEAMAAGKPIVATDVGGNSEILAGGKYGLLQLPSHAFSQTNRWPRSSRARRGRSPCGSSVPPRWLRGMNGYSRRT